RPPPISPLFPYTTLFRSDRPVVPGDHALELGSEVVGRPVAASDRDETQPLVEMPAAVEGIERRQKLPGREIAGRAEKDEAAWARHPFDASTIAGPTNRVPRLPTRR